VRAARRDVSSLRAPRTFRAWREVRMNVTLQLLVRAAHKFCATCVWVGKVTVDLVLDQLAQG
jgi:hypothetical protein